MGVAAIAKHALILRYAKFISNGSVCLSGGGGGGGGTIYGHNRVRQALLLYSAKVSGELESQNVAQTVNNFPFFCFVYSTLYTCTFSLSTLFIWFKHALYL